MMTARLIVNTIRSYQGIMSFVGHVGGDDFVFILPPGQGGGCLSAHHRGL